MPNACSLTGPERAARGAELHRLASDARRVPGGARLTFEPDAERRVRAIVAAEAECCPFLRFELRRTAAALEVEVTGPAEAGPILDELAQASRGGNG